jgi:hypothetical protein
VKAGPPGNGGAGGGPLEICGTRAPDSLGQAIEIVCLSLDFPGPVHAAAGELRKAVTARGPVQIVGPFEFGCCIPVAGFIEETPADLVADQRFGRRRAGKTQCFFVQPGRVVPLVAALIGLGKDKQRPEPVPGRSQQRHPSVRASSSRPNRERIHTRSSAVQSPSRACIASRSRTTSRRVAGSVAQISSLVPARDKWASAARMVLSSL